MGESNKKAYTRTEGEYQELERVKEVYRVMAVNRANTILDIDKQAHKLQEATRWRKVEEELPKKGDEILFVDKDDTYAGEYREDEYGDIKFLWETTDGFITIEATHWQPLPKFEAT